MVFLTSAVGRAGELFESVEEVTDDAVVFEADREEPGDPGYYDGFAEEVQDSFAEDEAGEVFDSVQEETVGAMNPADEYPDDAIPINDAIPANDSADSAENEDVISAENVGLSDDIFIVEEQGSADESLFSSGENSAAEENLFTDGNMAAESEEITGEETGFAADDGSGMVGASIVKSGTCGKNGDNLTWTLDSEGLLTISGYGDMCDYLNDTFSAERSRFAPWYDGRNEIVRCVITSEVTSIGDYAFSYCGFLENVSIPESVTSIGKYAFHSCSNLTDVILPSGVTSIGMGAFSLCRSLTSVSLPEGITRIEDFAFHSCSSLADVIIPDSVTGIGYMAFIHCTELKNVALPGSVTSIGNAAFLNSGLTRLEIPDSVTSIGADAFLNCADLTEVTIPDNVTSIGTRSFGACSNLISLEVPDDHPVFSSQDGVLFSKDKTILLQFPAGKDGTYVIPEGVTGIGSDAFYGCGKLTGVAIPDSVTEIGDYAFDRCSLTSMIIPGSVTEIGHLAIECEIYFQGSAPDVIKSPHFTTAYYPWNNPTWTEEKRRSYSENEESINWIPWNPGIEVAPDRLVLDVGQSENITVSIVNDDRVVSWESADERIAVVHDGVVTGIYPGYTVITITFASGWTDSAAVRVNGIPSIQSDCDTAAMIENAGDEERFSFVPDASGRYVFYTLSDIDTEVRLYDVDCDMIAGGNARLEYNLEKDWKYYFGVSFNDGHTGSLKVRLEKTVIPTSGEISTIPGEHLSWILKDGVLTISGTGTMGRSWWRPEELPWYFLRKEISKVVIEPGVTSIGSRAFEGCESLTAVIIPDSVTSIEICAFSGCKNLTGVRIPDNVTTIGNLTFSGCYSLTDLTLPDRLTDIGFAAFECCESLTDVRIPDSVRSIGECAFGGCYSLTAVTIPESVTSIGCDAFADCVSLKEIRFKGNAPVFLQDDKWGLTQFEGVTATAYYPYHNPTWTKDKMQGYMGFITWVPWNPATGEILQEETVPGLSLSKLTEEGFGKLGITWKSLGNAVDGYQLRLAEDESFRKIIGAPYVMGKNSYTKSNLRTGATYYVQVRAYKYRTGDDRKIFSSWSKSKSIRLSVPATAITSLTDKGFGKLQVIWKSRSRYVESYQVRWSTDKTFSKGTKTKILDSEDDTADSGRLTINALSTGTAWYVSVRTFNTINGKKIYSSWSGAKSIKLSVPETVITALARKGSGKFQVTWKNRGNYVNGYQVRWSTDKTFKTGTKTKVVTGKTSYTQSGLSKGKRYYVSVRTYRTVSGKKVYSAWSKAANIKV